MIYVSEITGKKYATEKECLEAEKAYAIEQKKAQELAEKKNADRKAAAEKVESARKAAVEANKVYREALNEFCKTYGAFHSTYNLSDVDDLFNWFFRF